MFLFYFFGLFVPIFNNPYFLMVETICMALVTWYITRFRKSSLSSGLIIKKNNNNHNYLQTVKFAKLPIDMNKLIERWQPEPLIHESIDTYHHSLRPRIVSSSFGHRITLDGHECLNLATHNYLSLVQNQQCLNAAIDAVDKYGVGSCGPRAFFGTSGL